MKKFLIYFVMLGMSASSFAQREQQIDVELLGSTNLVGVHFEQPLGKSSPFAVRGGLSYGYSQASGLAIGMNEDNWDFKVYHRKEHQVAVPLELNFITGLKKKNHLEIGLGTSLGYYHSNYDFSGQEFSRNCFGYFCFANLGWRHDFKKCITLRLGATATFDFGGAKAVERESVIAPYLSVGFRL